MKNKVSIVIPVKDKEEIVSKFIEGNKDILSKYKVIVVNNKGGDELKQFSHIYINGKDNLSDARRIGINLVKTEYILNLDTHVILPKHYINASIILLDTNKEIGAISIDHEKLMGHLGFGQSIWRTKLLKELYDWNIDTNVCECNYLWGKLNKTKYKLETLSNIRCKHLVVE